MNRGHTNLFPLDDSDFDAERKRKLDEHADRFEDKVAETGGFPFDSSPSTPPRKWREKEAEGADQGSAYEQDRPASDCDHSGGDLEYCPDCDEMVDQDGHDAATVAHFARELSECYRRISFRLIWDVIFSLANPDDRTMNKILNQIIECGVMFSQEEMVGEMNAGEVPADSQKKMMEFFTKAVEQSSASFKENYSTPLMTKDFLQKIKTSLRNNLK